MYPPSIALCFAFLFVVPFSELQNDFMNDNEQSNNSTMQSDLFVNSTKYRNEEMELTRFNSQKNSIKNNDEMQYESYINSTNNNYKNDSMRYESREHIIKNHEDNQTSMEFYANSTDINNFTLQEINENLTKTKDKDNFILYKLNSNGIINTTLVEYTACNNNITCIQFCCPFGDILMMITGRCIKQNYAVSNMYPFLNLNKHGNYFKDETVEELFFTVRDPCVAKGYDRKFLLPNTYMFFPNGYLYTYSKFILPEDYCIAMLFGNKYSVFVCDDDTTFLVSFVSICLLLSLLFLLLTFIIYSILPIFETIHSYTLRTHVGSLFITYVIMCFDQSFELGEVKYCVALAYIFYFFLLSSFFWLNVICFDIWWTFRYHRLYLRTNNKKKLIIYSIYAWGVTIVLNVICAIMDNIPLPENLVRPEMCEKRFWFGEKAQTLYFDVPISATIISNIFFFISTILYQKIHIAKLLRDREIMSYDENKQRFNMYLKLFIIMGPTWVLKIISWVDIGADIPQFIWYTAITVHCLQGLIIFIIFVCKKKVLQALLKRFNSNICGTTSTCSTRKLGSPETISMQQIDSSN
ncbi:PREDICTED: G-protein coupled receptor Mth2-like [Trachymyrmex septentrionalis]|uniref:G-protein coupled receptor Mth2-like n=1 Tax=Trachymyrmex septentrionalis TaxID=34720 RepID=UPI00084F05FC|nr:PREDICTED: G-protein coupled receptor Mth2-like [Trachymyrmex septentrionalis]